MTEILFASHNKGKVREIGHLLQLEDVRLLTLDDVHLAKFEVDETGMTYEQNAGLKAKTIGDKTRHITIADDSGIEVEALGGKPGVLSARYAKGSDADRVQKMLSALGDKKNRKAKFVSALVYYDPTTQEKHAFRGEVRGMLADDPRGKSGFGYDPIFIPDGHTQTFGELGDEVKNRISHRAVAVRRLREWLIQRLQAPK